MDIALLRVVLSADSAPVSKELDKVDRMLKDFAAKSHPAAQLRIETEKAVAALEAANKGGIALGRTLKAIQDKTVNVKVNYQTTGTPPKGTAKTGNRATRRSAREDGSHDTYASSILTASTTVPAAAGLVAATKVAIDFETAFTGVRKTVEGTSQDLNLLQSELRDMAAGKQAIPVSFQELSKIAENAGQLGIATPAVAKFTRVMADLGQTTNLSSSDAATALARLANITGMSHRDFDRLGSTVVGLGNKFAGTESEIASMALRIAGAGKQVGLSESQILGFATALSSIGVESEAGGSAISRVFVEIDNAVRSGGTSLNNFAKIAGTSSAAFKQQFSSDAAGAINAFIVGLKRISDEGGNVFGALEKIGLSEIRVRQALLGLSNAGTLTAEALAVGNQAWRENTALTDEAAKRYATTASQLQIFKNHAEETANDLTVKFLPVINDALKTVGEDLPTALSVSQKALDDIPPSAKAAAAALGAIVLSVGPLSSATGSVKMLGTALQGLAGFKGGALALGNPVAALAFIGTAALGYKSLKEVLGEVAEAQRAVTESAKAAQKHLGAALDVLADGDRRKVQITKLRADLVAAGDDAAKIGKIINDIAALERTVKVSAQSDIKTVLEHDLAAARREAEALRWNLKATVLIEPVVASMGTKVGQNIFGSGYQMSSDVRQGDVYNGIVAKIVDPISKLFLGGDDTPLKGDDWYSTIAKLNAGSEFTRRQQEAARRANWVQQNAAGPFALPMQGPVPKPGIEGARARATAALNTPAAKTTPTTRKDDWDTEEKTKRQADAMRLLKDQLSDTARQWEEYGRVVEDIADKQIEELSRIRGSVADVVQDLESTLLKSGVSSNSLNTFDKMVSGLKAQMGDERLLLGIYNKSRATSESATQKARGFQSQKELESGLDGVVSGGGSANVGNFDSVVMNAIIAGVKTPMGANACARFVSKAFDMLGVSKALERTDSAAQLLANAEKAGARRIPVSEAGAGDLLGSISPTANSKRHVGIGVGNGMFAAKNRDHHSPIAGYGWDFAYDTSALAGRGGGSGASSARGSGARPSMPGGDYEALRKLAERPQLAQAYTKYSKSTLQDMLRLHPVEKEGNAIRRQTLLDLAELTPELHKYAAAKGLDGKAAQGWVHQTRAAIYAIANFTEGTANATERANELKASLRGLYGAGMGSASEQIGNVKSEFKGIARSSFLNAEFAGKESQKIAEGKSPSQIAREMELYRFRRELPETYSDTAKNLLTSGKEKELLATEKRDRLKEAASATADYNAQMELLNQQRGKLAALGARPESEITEALQVLADYADEYMRALVNNDEATARSVARTYQARQADIRAAQKQIDQAKQLGEMSRAVAAAQAMQRFSAVERDPNDYQTRFDKSLYEWQQNQPDPNNIDPAARIKEQERLGAEMGTSANDEANRRLADLRREMALLGDETGLAALALALEKGELKGVDEAIKATLITETKAAVARKAQIAANEQVIESERQFALSHATNAQQRLQIELDYQRQLRKARGIQTTPEQDAIEADAQTRRARIDEQTATMESLKSEAERSRGMVANSISTGFSDGVLSGARAFTSGVLDQIMQEQTNRLATQITRGIYGRDSLEDAQGSTWGRGPVGGTPPFVPDSLKGPYQSQQSTSIASGIASALGIGGGGGNAGAINITAGSSVNVRGMMVSVSGGTGGALGGGAGSQPSLDQVFGALTKI